MGAVSLIGRGFVWLTIRKALAQMRQITHDLRQRDPADLSQLPGAPPARDPQPVRRHKRLHDAPAQQPPPDRDIHRRCRPSGPDLADGAASGGPNCSASPSGRPPSSKTSIASRPVPCRSSTASWQSSLAFLLSEGQQIIRNQSDLIPMLPVPELDGLSPADVAQMPGTHLPNSSGPGLLTYLD